MTMRLLQGVGLLLCLVFSGTVWAQTPTIKQRILMPGQVIEAHASFEAECTACHANFDKSAMTSLCLDCHDAIREDRNSRTGFHGQSPLASTKSCNTCHSDHIGRDGDIIAMQEDTFNHAWTRFPLEGKHSTQACQNCHKPDLKYREVASECSDCHLKDDFHKGALGTECQTCHQPQSWQQRLPFDHATTGFPLLGLHQDVVCSGCHAGQQFQFEQTGCVDCHRPIDVHAGKNGDKCDTCHTVNGWDQRIFDHETTLFPLRHKHSELPCRACHTDGVVTAYEQPRTCHSCHGNDDIHLGRNGAQCQDCHTTAQWKSVRFDHSTVTGFPLSGKHGELACTQCHTGALTDPLPRDCASCHAADDVHKNPDMQVCATCHITDSWNIINRFDHHFTNFPLVGMHQIVPCQSCHVGNQFAGTGSECVDCHKADDYHKGALGTQCHTCHSPNAWNLWQFDHEAFTGYPLIGSHKDLACEACHTPGTDPSKTSTLCGTCHAHQDIHKGAFGQNCGRCHSQTKFFELILQDRP